jgi:hypothetical protein
MQNVNRGAESTKTETAIHRAERNYISLQSGYCCIGHAVIDESRCVAISLKKVKNMIVHSRQSTQKSTR